MEITLKFSIEKRLQFFGRNEWIHLHSFCLCHFNDNLKIQSSFQSQIGKFSAFT